MLLLKLKCDYLKNDYLKKRSYLRFTKAIANNNYKRLTSYKKYKPKLYISNNIIINSVIEKLPFVLDKKYKFIFWKLFFKYTGSNIFGTLTNRKGDVFLSLSSGIFKRLKTRKDKTTVFIAKELGEIFSLILYKFIIKNIYFLPLINHRKVKSLLRFFFKGLYLICLCPINRIDPIRKVIRNGVRLRKVARK